MLWKVSTLRRVAGCGRYPTAAGASIGVRLTGGAAGFSGLQSCGSVWSDPVCSAKVLARRAVEIGAALAVAQARGYRLGMVTLTMRHHRGQALDDLWRAGAKGWGRATSGNGWVRARDRNGVVGWVRVWEVTEGRNGWHVHVHVVVVLEAGATEAHLDDLASGMLRRWSGGLQSQGLQAPLRRGQEWHLIEGDHGGAAVAEYLAKLGRSGPAAPESLGLELTHVQPGRARADLRTRPVWSLLDDLVLDGEAMTLARWHEWEAASKGKRQVGWSEGLRDVLAVPDERSDEELAAEELGTDDDTLLLIEPAGWQAMIDQPYRLPLVLDAAENGGLVALRSLLDVWGDVPYLVPAA